MSPRPGPRGHLAVGPDAGIVLDSARGVPAGGEAVYAISNDAILGVHRQQLRPSQVQPEASLNPCDSSERPISEAVDWSHVEIRNIAPVAKCIR